MPATAKRSYARYTLVAASLLGQTIAAERKGQRITTQDMADRLGITRNTLARVEKGDPKVELGLAFEACTLLGIRLFDADERKLARELRESQRHLTLLPRSIRKRAEAADDDF